MASRNDFIIILLLLAAIAVVLPTTVTADKFWVGDKAGWTINVDYQAWAKDKVFHIGDTLIFIYQKGNDSVYKVIQAEFQNCSVPVGKPGLTSGHDEITLTMPGKTWFISGEPTHCSEYKQKLAFFVYGEALAPAPTPTTPTTPVPAPMAPVAPVPAPATTPESPGNSAHGTQQASVYQVLFVAAVAFVAFLIA